MKIEIIKLVKACKGSMRKVIQLDDMIEGLLLYNLIEKEEYEQIIDEFLSNVEECYGKKFIENFFDICNSPNYIDSL